MTSLVERYDAVTYDDDGTLKECVSKQVSKSVKETMQTMMGEESECVYAILNPDNGYVKIGKTNSVKRRMFEIQTSCGSPIELIMAITPEPGYDESVDHIEKTLHRLLKEKRKTGEWFKLTLRDVIEVRDVFYRIEGIDMDEHEAWYSKAERKRLIESIHARP